jgi:hypothetical protein
MTSRLMIVGTVVLAIGVSGQVAVAAPAGGSRYRGTTSQGKRITLHVTPDGDGLAMSLGEIARCNRGPDKSTHGTYRNQRPSIKPDGSFDYRITYHLGPVPGFAERHTERHHVSGAFSADAKTVHGRVTVSDVGASGLRCITNLTFTAHAV